jgi:hypothetical protein
MPKSMLAASRATARPATPLEPAALVVAAGAAWLEVPDGRGTVVAVEETGWEETCGGAAAELIGWLVRRTDT